ncbi:hypothetical protein RV02_GL001125 [Enterococcus gilvus]|uniref:Putative N-acetylmannosamine-6-phosphate 2-epimerase n=1 Tax=Enterococcus gilvus ATCC BAA-350 TaxID=1158614 RepID=R2Y4B3_9ENTE|nr:hypothetical protein UKC_01391 [Enterococcus gilvus ATCC BAA-350]EOW83249.1 hypothetical protein I592_02576 [Enterococcus gilvus ATCC BAA-350]OJG41189.1 hypothetical protein RV02_GL001125 [Enterococcus gilvus]
MGENILRKSEVLASIKGGLVVSCQARKGWPMYGEDIMAAFAKAAEQGGAVAIRATEPENIRAIKKVIDLPIMGIYKQWYEGYEVYITPTFESAAAVAEAGASIIAIDGTKRTRPNGEKLDEICARIHESYPEVLIMADCDTLENGKYAEMCGADIVSTTLAGYTEETKTENEFNPNLISEMKKELKVPIVAEGHIATINELIAAYEHGAYSVVVGTAITRPEIITERFVEGLSVFHQTTSV